MSDSRESKRLIETLKKCLKNKGITYKDLSKQLSLSESSVKRLFASHNLSMQRLEQICDILDMSFYDITSMSRDESADIEKNILNLEQEQALADNVKLFIGFHLILNGWGFDQIKDAFDWSEPEVIKVFTGLDKIGLIQLLPENKVKLLTATSIRWRKDGAIRQKYAQHVFSDFLNAEFKGDKQFLDFELIELSNTSMSVLKRKLEILLKEVHDLAIMDHSLKQSDKTSTGVILGMRPWVFSLAVDSMTETYLKDRVEFHKQYE